MTDIPILNVATNALWEDFSSESSFPDNQPLLAHYTSIQSFEKIITSGELWLSNPLFMNDVEEIRFGMNEGALEFSRNVNLKQACGSQERYRTLQDSFEYLFNEFDKKHVLNTYVMCLSEHNEDDYDGLLSMWRGYGNGGAGAAIVFDTKKIIPNENSPLIIGKVHYATKNDRLQWINNKITTLSEIISSHEIEDDKLFYVAWAWINRLKTFAIFSKHNGFCEEKEWRVVYMSERDKEESYKRFFGHFATEKGIEPKLKLCIKPIEGLFDENISFENLIERIILGPSISSILSVNAIKNMLKNIGRYQLSEMVFASEIPYRPIG